MARAAGGGDTYYCVPQVAGSGQDCYRDRVTAVKHLLSIRDHHRRNPEKLFTPVWNAKANKWDLKPCMSDKCGPGAWTEAKIRTVKSRRDPSWLD